MQIYRHGPWLKFILAETNMDSKNLNEPNIKLLTKTLASNYKKYWKYELYNDQRKAPGQKNKLRTYRTFKIDFEYEEYWDLLDNKYDKKLLCNFRLGVNKLHIETGRYYPYIPSEDRLCYSCISHQETVEDEYHFILHCPRHSKLRNNLFATINSISTHFKSMNNPNKFIWLMNCRNKIILNNLSKYIRDAYNNRISKP